MKARQFALFRSHAPLTVALTAALIGHFTAPCAHAAALTWDANTTTSGAQDGNGTWITGSPNWRNTTTPTDNVSWTAGDAATFGAGVDGTYGVTVGGNISSAGLIFANSGYTLSATSAQTITLTAPIDVVTNKSATIGANVTVTRASNHTIRGGGTLNIVGTGATVQTTGSTTINVSGNTKVFVGTGGLLTLGNTLTIGFDGNTTNALEVNGGDVNITAVSAGALTLATAASGSASITLTNGNISNTSTGTGLRFGGTGTNTANSTFHLNGGTLTVGQVFEGNTSHSSNFNFNGGTLKVLATSTKLATFMTGIDTANVRDGGAIIDTNNAASPVIMGQNLTHSIIGGDLATDGGLTKKGLGTLSLTGTNTYTGNTSIQEGVLSVNSTASLPGYNSAGKVSVANGATLAVGNSFDNTDLNSLLGNATFAAGSNLGFDTVAGNRTYSSAVTGSLGLTKLSANVLTLDVGNSYTGLTTVSAGTLRIQHADALGTTAGNTTVANGATLQLQDASGISYAAESLSIASGVSASPVLLQNVSGNNTWNGTITTTGSGAIARISSDAGLLTLANTVTGSSASTQLVLQGDGNILVSGQITGASILTSSSIGNGTRTLGNTSNDFSGNVNMNGGTLKLNASGVIPNGTGKGNVTFGPASPTTATLDLNGKTETINGLSSSGTGASVVDNTAAGTAVLTVGDNDATSTFAGLIRNTGGALTLQKTGNGTLTLSGTANNTYSGETVVKAGTLKLNTSTSIGGSSKITVGDTGSSGTVLDVTTAGITVASAQKLAGIGSVLATGQTVTIDGTLAPGNSPGTLSMTVGNLDLGNATALVFELNPSDTAVGSNINDLVAVTGNLNLDGLLSVVATSGDFLSVAANTSWRLFNYSGSLTDDTLSLGSMPSLGSGLSWGIDTATTGQVNLIVIPEPGAALLGGLGVLALLSRRRD